LNEIRSNNAQRQKAEKQSQAEWFMSYRRIRLLNIN
jgi:hypothetical protein